MVEYTDPHKVRGMSVETTAPRYGHNANGYGRKIPTRYRIEYHDARCNHRKWHRVYMCQISNAGTAYIVVAKQWLVLDTETEYRLQEL